MQKTEMELSILIATVDNRVNEFNALKAEFEKQAKGKPVEIVSLCDNKEMPIGTKRQRLLEMAKGRFIVFFDDDDTPVSNYVDLILHAISFDVDCVSVKIQMTTNGVNPQLCIHRLRCPMAGGRLAQRYHCDWIRPITHFNPVLRTLALKAGFGNERYGEDVLYWNRINRLVKKDYWIPDILFHYNYSDKIPHNEKYGI